MKIKAMAKKKQDQKNQVEEPEVQTSTAENAEQNEGSETPTVSREESLEQEISALNDKHMRLFAEFENYKRRTAKEKLEMMRNASEGLIKSLLPVLDDFDRAKKFGADEQDVAKVREGFELIGNKLYEVLKKEGLEPVEPAIGKPMDTELHEAITQIPAPSEDLKGKIIDEVEKGYKLNEKVIRYTKVVVGQQ